MQQILLKCISRSNCAKGDPTSIRVDPKVISLSVTNRSLLANVLIDAASSVSAAVSVPEESILHKE